MSTRAARWSASRRGDASRRRSCCGPSMPTSRTTCWSTARPTCRPTFDARRSALRRHYRYLIWSHRLPSLWLAPLGLAPDRIGRTSSAMQAAADRLVGTHDFASFLGHRSQEPAGRTTVRTVERAAWWQDGESDRVRDHGERLLAAHGAWHRRDARRGGAREARSGTIRDDSRIRRPPAGRAERPAARPDPDGCRLSRPLWDARDDQSSETNERGRFRGRAGCRATDPGADPRSAR